MPRGRRSRQDGDQRAVLCPFFGRLIPPGVCMLRATHANALFYEGKRRDHLDRCLVCLEPIRLADGA